VLSLGTPLVLSVEVITGAVSLHGGFERSNVDARVKNHEPDLVEHGKLQHENTRFDQHTRQPANDQRDTSETTIKATPETPTSDPN